jgi:FkbM family methyltransferase
MSCDYFILTKSKNSPVDNDTENRVFDLNAKFYILPKNNLDYYVSQGLFEKYLIEWVKQFCSKDKNMLDIGAHSGTYSISLAEYCNHVYSFEPQKMTYYSLCGSVVLSNIKNITCIPYGLGSVDQTGTQTLHIVSDDGGGSSIHNMNPHDVLATEKIEIRTLDSFQLDNIGFIKMDVEDNELNVLLSSKETLKKSNYPPILFESNYNNEKLFQFLRDLSYDIVNINGYPNMFLANFHLFHL